MAGGLAALGIVKLVLDASFYFLIILVVNGVLAGAVIASLEAFSSRLPVTLDAIKQGYSIHFQLLLGMKDPLEMNVTGPVKPYAVLDSFSGWLIIPTLFGVLIGRVLAFREELRIVTDTIKSRVSAYEAVQRGKCPTCAKPIDFFDDDTKYGFVCRNCGQALIEAKKKQNPMSMREPDRR